MVAKTVPNGRGVPYPERLPVTFRRLPASVQADELVAWWWVCEWDVPVGQQSDQQVLAFPALNFTVDDREAGISGPTSSASTRALTGRGWVIGALLKPAATPVFTSDPTSLRDRLEPLHLPELRSRVADCAATGHLDSAVDVLSRWLVARAGALDGSALTANRMGRLATTDPRITSVAGLADAVGVSQSGLYRLARRYVGVSPYSMIRRRRLQEIAERIRLHPGESLADVAGHLGMTDQAHLGREFKSAFGITPGDYRSTCRAAERQP
ncbi:helix-turn-helix transcriptional regulator [Kocuria rhizophila]|uniref:helix-turn-helix transcriptional regulator n=1 Tax=Kocuria rhizophila TaxID=72000 RepID=UPI00174A27EB|nr:helix-turn-helix transcriptional regulator [Kocuria rhizophila]MCG7425733.1 helix-turn-helix transcriptional regulator [Kocuria rhizophila]MCT1456034.1 helix-turn-helix transcriptional regulator [Kocuria rhizophila]MCT1880094.1 helix-turn-helix transcriptional regulator [Kocuria rhizophila]MCT2249154.1 helix-turn-helix transcriptional regulator [Kocuria rhizophila]